MQRPENRDTPSKQHTRHTPSQPSTHPGPTEIQEPPRAGDAMYNVRTTSLRIVSVRNLLCGLSPRYIATTSLRTTPSAPRPQLVAERAQSHVQTKHSEDARDERHHTCAIRIQSERRDCTTKILGARGELAEPHSGQRDVRLARQLGAVVLCAGERKRGMQRQLEQRHRDKPQRQRGDRSGLQREREQCGDAEGLVAHGVEVRAVLAVVHHMVLAVDARPVDAHVRRLAQRPGDGAVEPVEQVVEDREHGGGEVPAVHGEEHKRQRAEHRRPRHVVGQHLVREERSGCDPLEGLAERLVDVHLVCLQERVGQGLGKEAQSQRPRIAHHGRRHALGVRREDQLDPLRLEEGAAWKLQHVVASHVCEIVPALILEARHDGGDGAAAVVGASGPIDGRICRVDQKRLVLWAELELDLRETLGGFVTGGDVLHRLDRLVVMHADDQLVARCHESFEQSHVPPMQHVEAAHR
mmetsp:Transcript_10739/g.21773  ORF Transcript_10739/g.21773 Transcript_10739/m.21773 type:complete len:467 (+) Transcript_10739:25-1425(+)